MPYNVAALSIDLALDHIAGQIPCNDPARLATLLKIALRRGLATELANQTVPVNLFPIFNTRFNAPSWMRRARARGETIWMFRPTRLYVGAIRHVADWIVAAIHSEAAWLSDCDARGHPKKLAKLGSLTQAIHQANLAMAKAAQNSKVTLLPEDTEQVMEFPDGARIIQLLTTRALDAESAAMGHCIGNGAYDGKLATQRFIYFSIRTPTGKPCVTLEIRQTNGKLALHQCRGKQNRQPIDKYMPYVRAFLAGRGIASQPTFAGSIEREATENDSRLLHARPRRVAKR